MKRQKLLISGLLSLMSVGMAYAEDTTPMFVKVVQSGGQATDTLTSQFGVASYDVQSSDVTLAFVDGCPTITQDGHAVAQLTSSELDKGGKLLIDYSSTASSLSRTLDKDYITLCSPFQLQVPSGSDVEVYNPAYVSGALYLNSSNKLAAGDVIAPGTPVLLKGNGKTITFANSVADAKTIDATLKGTSIDIATPSASGTDILTLGTNTSDATKYGFFKTTAVTIPAGKAWLETASTSSARGIFLLFGDPTAITDVEAEQPAVLEGEMYNTLGQRVGNGARGIMIVNGKKFMKN